ncbi:hypothetical protein D6764_03710 [Candidatus Woesearchaeota archaeon]|nr:MAG: hypothetical protein D6764_03710 [Candidatus Woesearchaeota archaeon]
MSGVALRSAKKSSVPVSRRGKSSSAGSVSPKKSRCSPFWFFLFAALSVFFLVLALKYLSSTIPAQKSMKLLAVSEAPNGSLVGSVADLSLVVRSGSGRVFIDTFPVTKLDTQISTRFAKEFACSIAKTDCSSRDFFYTLRSSSPLVGGPSAGAAASLLTLAVLDSLDLRDDVLLTGTINSGGIIGPVGGIKEKIDAASEAGASVVLVPQGSSLLYSSNFSGRNDSLFSVGNATNSSVAVSALNISDYALRKGIRLVEISNLEEAVWFATGSNYSFPVQNIEPSPYYLDLMRSISSEMCNRTSRLLLDVRTLDRNNSSHSISGNSSGEPLKASPYQFYIRQALNLSSQGFSLLNDKRFYAAASRCFGANIYLRAAYYSWLNFSVPELEEKLYEIKGAHAKFSSALRNVARKSVTDLQTFIIVDERVREASKYISLAEDSLAVNDSQSAVYYSAYAIERLYSAKLWSRFFGLGTRSVSLDESSLRDSCLKKLSEAEERIQYVRSFIPFSLSETRSDLESAYEAYADGNYELCLFRASKSKAELDVLVSVLNIKESQISSLLDAKLRVAERVIAQETAKGNFPILGYSYFQYASALAPSDRYSALLYAEYAIELSNLELYFDVARREGLVKLSPPLALFLCSLLAGFFAGFSGVSCSARLSAGRRSKGKK